MVDFDNAQPALILGIKLSRPGSKRCCQDGRVWCEGGCAKVCKTGSILHAQCLLFGESAQQLDSWPALPFLRDQLQRCVF